MATQGGDPGCFHAGWPAADDQHLARLLCRLQGGVFQRAFGAHCRIDRTTHASGRAEQAADAALVAGDARAHLLGVTGERLAHQIRIGDLRTGEGDHVGIAGADDLVGFLQGSEPACDDGWRPAGAGDLGAGGHLVAHGFVHAADELREAVIVAEGDVDEID
ncbi:hypothetical protein D3C78_1014910 [compost metagenome]